MAVIWRWFLKKKDKMANLSIDHWVRIKDGKIIAVGSYHKNGESGTQIVRYLPDGTLDQTFDDDSFGDVNSNGILRNNFYARTIDLEPDGTIVINKSVSDTPSGYQNIVYDSSGNLYPTYEVTGAPIRLEPGGVYSTPVIGNVDFVSEQNDGSFFLGAAQNGLANNYVPETISLWQPPKTHIPFGKPLKPIFRVASL